MVIIGTTVKMNSNMNNTNICFFDTETTGFIKKGELCQPGQARCVQLAGLLTDKDGNELGRVCEIIKPEGFIIPDRVAEIHGITTARAQAEGKDRIEVLSKFQSLFENSCLVVAHNFDFDRQIMEIEEAYSDGKFDWTGRPASYCTMKATTNICKIPSARGGYKWPKLMEVYKHFFGKEFENAHDALADMLAMRDVFMELIKLNLTPLKAPSL